jgi:two-component system, cell cycle sensor histidine kinase and response regulator CckA
LPASESAAQEVIGDSGDTVLQGNGTVLLVDDEEDVLEISKAMIEAIGYKTITSRGGQEAIKLYQERKDHIDLVLLDMIMPSMNGGKIYDHLKEINPSVKVILVSGYSLNGTATEILSRGCNGFIQKPFKIKDLSMKIRDILGK